MVTLQLRQISVPPGHRLLLNDVKWQEFEAILEELGEHRGSRIAYSQGTLEFRMPLPEHEFNKEIIGDMVRILIEELEIDFEPFGSTTFQEKSMLQAIEPDKSFYIQNYALMIGKKRIDLTVDPAPDLAIEVDLTSKTQLDAYVALGVPEIWRYENKRLQINVLEDGKYVESEISPTFPNLPIIEAISQYCEQSQTAGTSQTLRLFRNWVKEQIQN